jgi:hypothetical protein
MNVRAPLASLWALLTMAAFAPSGAAASEAEPPPLADFAQSRHALRLSVGGVFTLQSGIEKRTVRDGRTVIAGTLPGYQPGAGIEYGRSLSAALSLVAGAMFGDNAGYSGVIAFAGVSYRILGLHPRVLPVLTLALQHQWGFPGSPVDRNTITGAGLRTGLGVDFALTRRLLVGVSGHFDFGPRLLPGVGVLAAFRVWGGPMFLF